MFGSFITWFNSHSAVGLDVFLMVFKYLIPSSVMAFVLWGKPAVSKKINNYIETTQSNYSKLIEAVLIIVNMIVFGIFSLSSVGLILFILLALGL